MKWIRDMLNSVYDPKFYRELMVARVSASVKYFLGLMGVFAILAAIPFYVSFSSWISRPDGFQSFRDSVASLYPDELVLRYQDGHVTSNVEEPYFVAMPAALRDSVTASNGETARNLLVVDTTHTVVPEDFSKYDTVAILGNTALWVNDPQKGIRVNTFDTWKADPFTVDKNLISGFIEMISGILRPVLVVSSVLLPILIFFGSSVGFLVYLLFGALIVLIVGKVRNVDLTYGQSYRLGLHLLTVPVLYSLVKGIFPVLAVPFMFSAILAIFAFINFAPVGETQVEVKVGTVSGKDDA